MTEFLFTLMTNDAALANIADAAGIDRIGIDLETLGKLERQPNPKHWISDHVIEDLRPISRQLSRAQLFARINPIQSRSKDECKALLDSGVEIIMLPYFSTVREVEIFVDLIDDRAKKILLVETPAALSKIDQIVNIEGVDEVHFGLNDLHLAMGLPSHFHILSQSLLDEAIDILKKINLPFGIGGVARMGQGGLPIEPELILAQLVRLGATRALISRSFFGNDLQSVDLHMEMKNIRHALNSLALLKRRELDHLFDVFCDKVEILHSI